MGACVCVLDNSALSARLKLCQAFPDTSIYIHEYIAVALMPALTPTAAAAADAVAASAVAPEVAASDAPPDATISCVLYKIFV